MSSEWYCLIGNREYGPLDIAKVCRLAQTGQLTQGSLVRVGQDGAWIAAGDVEGLFSDIVPPPQENPQPTNGTSLPRVTRPAMQRYAVVMAIAAACALIAAVPMAYVLGRRSATPQPVAQRGPTTTVPLAAAPSSAVPGSSTVLPIAEKNQKQPPKSVEANSPSKKVAPPAPVAQQPPIQASPFDEAAEAKRRIAEAGKSVTRIEVEVAGRPDPKREYIGSGFLVGRRMLATSFHVIEGAQRVQITFPDGRATNGLGWYAIDAERDLALIECDSEDLPPLKLAVAKPKKLDTVYAVGSSLDPSGTVSSGIISGIHTGQELGRNVTLFQTTADVAHGNSGGPLLNDGGRVVGVSFAYREGDQNLNLAISSEHIAALLKSVGNTLKLWNDLPQMSKPLAMLVPNVEKPKADPLAELLAKQQQITADAEKKRLDVEKTENELNRVIARAGQLTAAIAAIEAEGTALTVRRDQLYSAIQGASSGAAAASSAAVPYIWDPVRQGYVVNQEAAAYNAAANAAMNTAESLKQQYDAICQQIGYKAQQRDELVKELNVLRKKYDQLRVK